MCSPTPCIRAAHASAGPASGIDAEGVGHQRHWLLPVCTWTGLVGSWSRHLQAWSFEEVDASWLASQGLEIQSP